MMKKHYTVTLIMIALSAIMCFPACTRSIVRSDRLDSTRILSLDPTDSLACLDDEDAGALVPELKNCTDSLYGDKSLIALRDYDYLNDDKALDDVDKFILLIGGILGVLFAALAAGYTIIWLYPFFDKINDYRKCSRILNWMAFISCILIGLSFVLLFFSLDLGNKYFSRALWLLFAGAILVVVHFELVKRVSAKLCEFNPFRVPDLRVTYYTIVDRISRLHRDSAYIDLRDGDAVPFVENRDGAFRSELEVKAVRLNRHLRYCIEVLAGEPGRSLEECRPDDGARWYGIRLDDNIEVNGAILLLLAAKLERMER